MSIYKNKFLRGIAMPLLKRFGRRSIKIRNHYTGDRLRIDAFLHKGYWYHGKNRERDTMDWFSRLVPKGGTVWEVGGHVGYITQYFAKLVGESGSVVVFEPGENNLPFISANVEPLKNVQLVRKAVSNSNGEVEFFLDDLTGQNNSLLPDYDVFNSNKKNSYVESSTKKCVIEAITLDQFASGGHPPPDFIKIDIEGAELLALEGATTLLERSRPMLMVEVTSNEERVSSLLKGAGYRLFSPIEHEFADELVRGNVFCLHSEQHGQAIQLFSDLRKEG